MTIMLRRSIGLSESTSDAWKSIGGWFPRRERNTESCLDLIMRQGRGADPIINLGDTTFHPSDNLLMVNGITGPVYNLGDNIRHITQPGRTRLRLGEFLPPDPRRFSPAYLTGDTWIKAPGQGGQGKTRIQTTEAITTSIPAAWDMQMHVEGQEYRVITVDDKVVQVSERYGLDGDRTYKWIGVKAAPTPVKEIAREATRRLDGHNIIGWDIIMGNMPDSTYVLEGNSSPGVNRETASRIFKQIKGDTYE